MGTATAMAAEARFIFPMTYNMSNMQAQYSDTFTLTGNACTLVHNTTEWIVNGSPPTDQCKVSVAL